jgi:hypothetical protein
MSHADDADREQAVRRILHGQSAPISTDGHGRFYLARCPVCGTCFTRNGAQVQPVTGGLLTTLTDVLGIDARNLPDYLCEPCHRTQNGGGLFEIDEYRVPGPAGTAAFGFGYSWESPGLHFLAALFPLALLPTLATLQPDILTQPQLARRALHWLAHRDAPADAHIVPPHLAVQIAGTNPPGHGDPGTEQWIWQGVFWLAPTSPVGPGVALVLQATPPGAPFAPEQSLALWRVMAQQP